MTQQWYAPRVVRCIVCKLPQAQWSEVNAAIWDGMARRNGSRPAGQRAYIAQTGVERLDIKVIDRHIKHIEATWHTAAESVPTTRERAGLPIDYDSMTDRAGRLSAAAMERLEEEIPGMEPKDLIATAKLGVSATQHRQALQAKNTRHAMDLAVLFGLGAGMIGALPEHETIDVTPVSELRGEMEEERALLEANARKVS